MSKKDMLSIFVSSTYKDLNETRGLIIDEIEKSLKAVAMERFLPVSMPSHDETISHLDKSDVCIFIIGDFYGSIIDECSIKDVCGECKGGISYTHCEYKRAVKAEKPHMVYIVKNKLSEILFNIKKFDLESMSRNDISKFLRSNNMDESKVSLFSGYTLEEVKGLWNVLKTGNKEKLDSFKDEVKKELYCPVEVSKKDDYYDVHLKIINDLKENIIRWYKEGKIRFTDFAGRRDELAEFFEKLHDKKSVCVVGTGGVGKTSLIQVGLLLERLTGRKVYAIQKEYDYKYTNAGYSFAKRKFKEMAFIKQLKLEDILMLVFREDIRYEDILRMNENDQILHLLEELNREGSILYIDDLQDADENIKRFVYTCGNNLSDGAVISGVRKKQNCYSTIGPLSGLQGPDLKEMIVILAKIHSIEKYVNALDVWSKEVSRITQGHPILVDIMVKNADHFRDFGELEGITGLTSLEDQEAVNEVMDRLIRNILTEEELKIISGFSVFYTPLDEKIFGEVQRDVLYSIIDKGFLSWDEGKLVFTFDAIRELLEVEAPIGSHEIANEYYLEEFKRLAGTGNWKWDLEYRRKAMNHIYYILNNEEIRVVRALSHFRTLSPSIYDEIDKEILNSLINKGFLEWKEDRLTFACDMIRELIETDVSMNFPNP